MDTVEFLSSGSRIRGYFFLSAGESQVATVLFLQGFPGIEGDELICERLAQGGVNVLTFNYRGTFRSEGLFSFSNAIEDVEAALRFLNEPQNVRMYSIDPEKIVLGGWSFGSGIMPAAAARYPEARRMFAISGRDFSQEARKIENDPEYAKEVIRNLETTRIPRGPVNFSNDLLSNLIHNRAAFEIERLVPLLKDRDILLVGAWDDDITPIEGHILPFYRSLASQGARVRIEAFQDDHEFTKCREQLVQVLLKWLVDGWWALK